MGRFDRIDLDDTMISAQADLKEAICLNSDHSIASIAFLHSDIHVMMSVMLCKLLKHLPRRLVVVTLPMHVRLLPCGRRIGEMRG